MAVTALQKQINSTVRMVRNLIVDSPTSLQTASGFLLKCKEREVLIGEEFDDIIKKANETHKTAVARKNLHLKPINDAKTLINQKVSAYNQELNRLEGIKQAAATKKARELEESKRKTEVSQLKDEGFLEEAKVVQQEIRPLTVTSTTKRVMPKGMSMRANWQIKVVDAKTLAAEKPEYMIPDLAVLKALVKAQKGACVVPGCTVWNEATTVQRKV